MRRWMVMGLFAALALPGAGARAQVIPTTLEARFQNRLLAEALLPDSRFVREAGIDHDRLRHYFHRSAADTLSGGYLSAHVDRLYGIERVEVSRLGVAMGAAELGASFALVAGALGSTFGGWDDKTTWYLVGGAAAAGALWGGTIGAENPRWRVRYRWEPIE